jgi:hypothetical protein
MRVREIIIELFDPKLAIDLEWAEGSDYIAARGYVTVTNPDGYGGEYGNEEEVELEVEFGEFPHRNRKEYEVQFKVGGSYDITGGGNANVIFATVIQACKDFVEMYNPDRLFFTAKEQSRARMYDTITKRVAKQVGWHVIPFDEIQKDPLYRNSSDNGFVFVIDKGAAPEKWSSDQKPQHGSFMPIFYVYNVDKDTPTVAVKVRAPNRETAVQHAMKIEPSFKDLDSMQIHALSSLPKREVTDVIDGGTAQVKESITKATLKESKSAPLYHFTTWDNLISILSSNQLTSPSGKIYLTRDYTRQFIPHEGKLFKQPYGIRIDQELLSRDYGRKLQAGGQDIGWDEKKRQAWLSDPKNAHEIEKVKQTGRGSGSRYDGADPQDIIKGTVTQSRRWESEEHLNVKNLPNLDKYITGIVIGSAPLGSKHFSQEIDPDPLTKLADILINLFSGPKGFEQRNLFLDSANKLNVPIVYERKEFSPEQVKKRIIQLYSQRKKERETEQGKAQQDFKIITNPAGGGIATGGSDINAVLKKLSINPKYRDLQIYGYSIGYGPDADKKMFDKPVPLLQLVKEPVRENFADGRNPQDKGDSKRHGVPTKASVSTLRKVAKQGGRKGQLAHWMANMKAGKAKKK